MGNRAENLVERICELPTLPQVAMELAEMLENPKTSVRDIQKIVLQDPSISSRLLKLVNSAFYGLSRRVSSLDTAITILGFNAVKNIALSSFVFDFFDSTDTGFNLHDFWKHSMAAGIAFTEVARACGHTKVQDAYIFGLLHDLGRLTIKQFDADSLQEAQGLAEQEQISLTVAEKRVLGMDHTELGHVLAHRWGFPEPLATALRYHHTPQEAPGDTAEFAALTHISDLITHCLGLGASGDNRFYAVEESAFSQLGLNQNKIGSIMDGTLASLKQCGPMISIMTE